MMKQRGFILAIILFLLSIVGIMTQMMMRHSLMSLMITRHFKQQVLNSQIAWHHLRAAKKILGNPKCIQEKVIYHGEVARSWWQAQHLCVEDHFWVLIEPLNGALICNQRGFKINFYRITVRSMGLLEHSMPILQSTLAKTISQKIICKTQIVNLRSSRLSWRKIG